MKAPVICKHPRRRNTAAMQAATGNGGKTLGRDDVGQIAEGFHADIVIYEGKAWEDPSILENPVVVIQGGRVVYDAR